MNDILDLPMASMPGGETGPSPSNQNWSDLQREIFIFAETKKENLLIRGVAGCGKTTTIIQTLKHIQGTFVFLAFNADIAEAIRVKTGYDKRVVRTLNSLGHGLWWKYSQSSTLDNKKSYLILESFIGKGSNTYKDFSGLIARLVSLAKSQGFGLKSDPHTFEFTELCDMYSIDFPLERQSELCELAKRVFLASINRRDIFDYDDQVYGPLKHGWSFPFFNNIVVDETQDLNTLQHMFIEEMAKYGSRLIAVGDHRQAIYGFRGALSNSMDLLGARFKMAELPLSITYRCPQYVVDCAREYCPEITARPGAPDGEVKWIMPTEHDPEDFGDQLVICRNNGPLFRSILSYIRAKRPCQVKTNFIESFGNWIRSFKAQTTTELITKLDEWYLRESTSAREKGFLSKLYAIKDRYETARMLALEFKTVDDLLNMVKALGDSRRGTIFSTIHRAKGLEYPSVYILAPQLIPATFATSDSQLEQEDHLMYVAITRSAQNLTFGV